MKISNFQLFIHTKTYTFVFKNSSLIFYYFQILHVFKFLAQKVENISTAIVELSVQATFNFFFISH